jgi:hypothetical protein
MSNYVSKTSLSYLHLINIKFGGSKMDFVLALISDMPLGRRQGVCAWCQIDNQIVLVL